MRPDLISWDSSERNSLIWIAAFLSAVLALLFSAGIAAQSEAMFGDIDWSAYSSEPIEARVGIQIDQLTDIDQKSETFGVVGTIRMQWTDPNLAFAPDADSLYPIRVYTAEKFRDFADSNGLLAPGFLILNRQGRLNTDDSTVVVFPDGSAIFAERFLVTLQAPDFDFRKYPFDSQHFHVRLGFLLPSSLMRVSEVSGFSGMGEQLGEEEWVVAKTWVDIDDWDTAFGFAAPRFSLGFSAHRHLQYYVLRIFLPLGILLAVTYSTFLLRDFARRIEICTTALLTFVAFNFAISNDLPRLGYLTFLDAVIGFFFLIIGLTVVWNVVLRRMELNGRGELARHIDFYTLWIYPVSQGALVYLAWLLVS